MSINILHLSDIHWGCETPAPHVDNKVDRRLTASSISKMKRLKSRILALPSVPDYVVISGDITFCADMENLQKFNQFLEELVALKKLPDTNRFVIVPGNHDVSPGSIDDLSKRFADYYTNVLPGSVVPWNHYGSLKMDACKKNIVARLRQNGPSAHPVPFLLDHEKQVVFYALNSCQ